MRALLALLLLLPAAALAQTSSPPAQAPMPFMPALQTPVYPTGGQPPGAAGQGYGGCYGCSYTGDYYGSNAAARRPAPPLRLQGQWRNGWWYY